MAAENLGVIYGDRIDLEVGFRFCWNAILHGRRQGLVLCIFFFLASDSEEAEPTGVMHMLR